MGEMARRRVRRPGITSAAKLEATSEERRISMAMKQKTARTMNRAKAARKAESTVRMAADKTIRNESTASRT